MVLDECGYTDMLKDDKSAEAPGRLDNLKEFVRSMEQFESLAAFLEHVSLVMEIEQNDSGDRINLMTLHAAKGLEFDTVFLPGWEEGLFPVAAHDGRERACGARGGTPPRLCRADAGEEAHPHFLRRQSPRAWLLAERAAVALHHGNSRRPCRERSSTKASMAAMPASATMPAQRRFRQHL